MSEIKNDIEGCYAGNTIKYIRRWKKKNDLEDLKKARMYLNWLIDHEEKKHPHHSGPKPFSEMTKEDTKREFLSESEKEKKEPPKNGRYSMGEDDCCSGECKCKSKEKDCFVPWQIQPKMVPTYELGMSPIEKQGAVEIIWDQFCDAFLNALKEVSKEEKEKKDEE